MAYNGTFHGLGSIPYGADYGAEAAKGSPSSPPRQVTEVNNSVGRSGSPPVIRSNKMDLETLADIAVGQNPSGSRPRPVEVPPVGGPSSREVERSRSGSMGRDDGTARAAGAGGDRPGFDWDMGLGPRVNSNRSISSDDNWAKNLLETMKRREGLSPTDNTTNNSNNTHHPYHDQHHSQHPQHHSRDDYSDMAETQHGDGAAGVYWKKRRHEDDHYSARASGKGKEREWIPRGVDGYDVASSSSQRERAIVENNIATLQSYSRELLKLMQPYAASRSQPVPESPPHHLQVHFQRLTLAIHRLLLELAPHVDQNLLATLTLPKPQQTRHLSTSPHPAYPPLLSPRPHPSSGAYRHDRLPSPSGGGGGGGRGDRDGYSWNNDPQDTDKYGRSSLKLPPPRVFERGGGGGGGGDERYSHYSDSRASSNPLEYNDRDRDRYRPRNNDMYLHQNQRHPHRPIEGLDLELDLVDDMERASGRSAGGMGIHDPSRSGSGYHHTKSLAEEQMDRIRHRRDELTARADAHARLLRYHGLVKPTSNDRSPSQVVGL